MESAIKALPWVKDGIDESERESVQELIHLAAWNELVFSALIDRPWVQDGFDKSEIALVVQLGRVARADEAAALRLVDIPFLETLDPALIAVAAYEELFNAVLRQPWVKDGLGDSARTVILHLGRIATKDEAAALRILDMPFLQTVEPVDAGAMASLWRLASTYREQFQQVMAHPTLRDGITDEWAKVVTVLGALSDHSADRINRLLDPERVPLEERTIDLPLSGEVVLTIIRTRPGSSRSMNVMESTVRDVESFMGTPLPLNFVILLFEEDSRFGGLYVGTHIILHAGHDVDHAPLKVLPHEVAHYYWTGNHAWINEGAATFMMLINENGRVGVPRWALSPPCPDPGSIAELERLDPHAQSFPRKCLGLGERLFLDLYYTLGDTAFRQGFRNLYLMSKKGPIGISHIREAFKAGAPDLADAVDTIVGRWYDGTEPYDLSHLDRGPVDPSLPSIEGRIDSAHLALTQEGQAISSFSSQHVTEPVWLSIDYSYEASSEQRELQLVIVDFFEDGFMFRRREVTLKTTPGLEGSSYHTSVGWTELKRSPIADPGRYWVYVYHEGRKVVEVEYEVTA